MNGKKGREGVYIIWLKHEKDRYRQRLKSSKQEIKDLNEEFQDHRELYLKDIREQQLEIDLLKGTGFSI